MDKEHNKLVLQRLRPRGRSGLKFSNHPAGGIPSSLRPRGRSGLKFYKTDHTGRYASSPSSRAEWVEIDEDVEANFHKLVSVLAGGVG